MYGIAFDCHVHMGDAMYMRLVMANLFCLSLSSR
jgi:hypothetical protein